MTLTEGRQSVYTENIARGGTLLEETRRLLVVWRPGEGLPEFVRRVREADVLGKATARTVRDYVWTFTRRFVTPPDSPAHHLRRVVPGTAPRQLFTDLVLYYLARQEVVLADFITLCYWPAVRAGRLSLSLDDARRFLWEAEQDGRIPILWSSGVRRNMPARLLNFVSDFGLLGPLKAGHREVLPYRPVDGTIAYLAYLLHHQGVTDAAIAQDPAWALFGLEPVDVWHALDLLAGEQWFLIQRAGEVVRITWAHASMEDVVDALAG